ncbi:MAG: exo-beta-N-acetylmuramidase NamZ domain-containing protein [Hyphomicrobiaceae bacterium]
MAAFPRPPTRRTFIAGVVAATGPSLMGNSATGEGSDRKAPVLTGADRLAADNFSMLRSKRVGLITNHTGRVGAERLIDVMARAEGISLAAILTPEHGLAGMAEAGAKVAGGADQATGIKVHSLYGSSYKPTPAMLTGLDVLLFDMQDIGTRFYTYISTMGLAMQAAAAAGLPFIVLDRPNPLGGDYISGFVLEPAFASFVGRFPIPIAHGLSVGELARMIKGERMLPGLDGLALDVIDASGWRRGMRWPETGRAWVATSPNIPAFESALAYPGTGLFEATVASEGRGTDAPFLLIGHAAIDADAIADELVGAGLRGVRIAATRVKPRAIAGVATSPRFLDRNIEAVRLNVTDAATFKPVEAGVHLLVAFHKVLAAAHAGPLVTDTKMFDRLAGTDRLRKALTSGMKADAIIATWRSDVARFAERRARYFAY